MEGFSIREYASRMRIVDVVKCWPFDETIDEEAVKSLLPPISIKKFTWWFDEIDCLDSKSGQDNFNYSKNKKKLKGKEGASLGSDVEASDLNIKIANMKSLKGKGKTPKKRSIVELFAVAPQIEKVISSEEEEEEEEEEEDGFFNPNSSHEEINWGVKGKRNLKKKNDKEKLIKKPKTKNKNVDLSPVPNKVYLIDAPQLMQRNDEISRTENHCKLKLQFQDNAIGNPSSSRGKELETDILDRSNLQHSDAHKITMTRRDVNPISENENPRILENCISNNHAKESSIEQPTQFFFHETVKENQRGKQKADEHLHFSENDDILSLKRKAYPSVECFNLQKDYSQGVEKGSFIAETSGNEDFCNRSSYEVDFGVHYRRAAPVCFKDYLGTHNSLKQAKDKGQANTSINNSHPFHNEPYPYIAPEESMQSLFSLTRRARSGNICGERIINGIEKDFVGLPLNSHGEFMASNSSSNLVIKQTMNSKDHSNPFLVEHYVKENPLCVIPSQPNFSTQLQSNRIDVELDLLKVGNCSFSMGKEDKKAQSTMRLMGKEFQVGGRGFQGFDEDERIWKDKHVTDHELRSGNKSINDWNEPSLGRLGETPFCPSEFTINPRSESSFTGSHDFQSSLMHPDGFVTRKFNEAQNLFPKFPTSAYIAEYESFIEPSNATASYHISRPFVSSSAVPRPPSFRFPFMHPDREGHVWKASMNRFDVSEKEIAISDCRPYWNSVNGYHPSAVIATESSMSLRPQVLYMQRPVGPTCPVQSQYALMPSYPRFVPLSAAQERQMMNQKRTRERIISNIGIRGRNSGKKDKMQHSALSNVPFKPVWLPGLGVQQRPQIDNYEFCAQSSEREFEHGTQITNPNYSLVETTSGVKFLESENSERIYRF